MYSEEKDHPLHFDPDHVHEPQVPTPFDTMNKCQNDGNALCFSHWFGLA
jgi:hypothetical protein